MPTDHPPSGEDPTVTEATTTAAPEADDNLVTLKLAHPLRRDKAEEMRAKPLKQVYSVGDEITVTREWGRGLIDAGYAQVDPTDAAAVRAALRVDERGRAVPRATAEDASGENAGGANSVDTEKVPAPGGQGGEASTDSSGDGSSTATSRRSGGGRSGRSGSDS
jgi:hypothetical protein